MTKIKHPSNKYERLKVKVRKKFAKPSIRFDDKKKQEEERASKVWRKKYTEYVREAETSDELSESLRDS